MGFLRSLVRHGKEGSEVYFFAKLVDQNEKFEIVQAINHTIRAIKKKHNEIMSRSDDTFKKIKISFNEALIITKKIFHRKFVLILEKGQPEMIEYTQDEDLKNRIRDYMLQLQHGSSVIETNALVLLEVIHREACLLADMDLKRKALLDNSWNEEDEEDNDDDPQSGLQLQQPVEKLSLEGSFKVSRLNQIEEQPSLCKESIREETLPMSGFSPEKGVTFRGGNCLNYLQKEESPQKSAGLKEFSQGIQETKEEMLEILKEKRRAVDFMHSLLSSLPSPFSDSLSPSLSLLSHQLEGLQGGVTQSLETDSNRLASFQPSSALSPDRPPLSVSDDSSPPSSIEAPQRERERYGGEEREREGEQIDQEEEYASSAYLADRRIRRGGLEGEDSPSREFEEYEQQVQRELQKELDFKIMSQSEPKDSPRQLIKPSPKKRIPKKKKISKRKKSIPSSQEEEELAAYKEELLLKGYKQKEEKSIEKENEKEIPQQAFETNLLDQLRGSSGPEKIKPINRGPSQRVLRQREPSMLLLCRSN